jgi:hypothetical protein
MTKIVRFGFPVVCFLFNFLSAQSLFGQSSACKVWAYKIDPDFIADLRRQNVDTVLFFHIDSVIGRRKDRLPTAISRHSYDLVIWKKNGMAYKKLYKDSVIMTLIQPCNKKLIDYFFEKNISDSARQSEIQRYYYGWPDDHIKQDDNFYFMIIYYGNGCFYQMLYETERNFKRNKFSKLFRLEQRWFKLLEREVRR